MGFASALVTGSGGFLGRALVGALCGAGVSVTCLVRGDAPAPPGTRPLRTRSLADLSEVAGAAVEVVFHLAAYGVRPEHRDRNETFAANVAGTAQVVALAQRLGARGVVYSGSCSEYARPPYGVPVGEDAPLTTASVYGASKAAGGMFGQAAARQAGLGFVWLRLFGAYGPGEADYRLLPQLLRQLAADQPVSLSPGEQVRDFLYVDDMVAGLVAAAGLALDGRCETLNLCSGRAVSVRVVAEQVARSLGKPDSLLRFGALPYRPDDVMWMVGDNARMTAATDWRPKVTLDDGIGRMAAALSWKVG